MTELTPDPLWDDALTLCRDLQRGTISSVDLMRNVYARIQAINPAVNALVNLLDEQQALALAAAAAMPALSLSATATCLSLVWVQIHSTRYSVPH